MPGTTAAPTRSRAWAASRQATRIRAIVSASFTSLPVYGAGAGRSTYSGRGIEAGTSRRGGIAGGAIAGGGMGRVYGRTHGPVGRPSGQGAVVCGHGRVLVLRQAPPRRAD